MTGTNVFRPDVDVEKSDSTWGLLFSAWLHLLLTWGYIPESVTPCAQGIPCSHVQVEWLGFLTIPLLSALSFSAIGLALIVIYYKEKARK